MGEKQYHFVAISGDALNISTSRNDTHLMNTTSECVDSDWTRSKHILFHIANVCFAVAFVSPNMFHYHLMLMRGFMCTGYFLVIIWTGIMVCFRDMLVWNALFLTMNLGHLLALAWEAIPSKLDREMEEIYIKYFRPLRMSRTLFKEFIGIGRIRTLRLDECYAEEGVTIAGQQLSILISGSMKVTLKGHLIHFVSRSHFIDSVEWERCCEREDEESDVFQVTITPTNECRFIEFPRDRLKYFLRKRHLVAGILHNVIGKDIIKTLHSIQNYIRFINGARRDVIFCGILPMPHSISLDRGISLGSLRGSPVHRKSLGSPMQRNALYGSPSKSSTGSRYSRGSPMHRPTVTADHRCDRYVTTAYGQMIFTPERLRETAATAFIKPVKTFDEMV